MAQTRCLSNPVADDRGLNALIAWAPPSYALKVSSEEEAVVIAGTETGNITETLLAFAEDSSVTGDVGGITVAAGDSVKFEPAMLGGDL